MGKEISLNEMHSLMKEMLCDIDLYCRKNNIRYSLGGGTLLGAIRYKGFIPWDDDVDIMMPRPDYDKFVQNYKSDSGLYECIDCVKNEQTVYAESFAKVHHKKTICNEEGRDFFRYGIFIDIFPIDGMPDEELKASYHIRLCNWIRRVIIAKLKPLKNCTTLIEYFLKFVSTVLNFHFLKMLNKKVLTHYCFKKSNYAGCIIGRYGNKERYEKKIFEQYIVIPFDGVNLSAIADYDIYLRQHYGDDYMLEPPLSKRESHKLSPIWI